MIQIVGAGSSVLTKLLIVGALAYGYSHRTEIRRGISNFLEKNQTVQEAKNSLKWAYNELRPRTEVEKAQHKAYAEEQRRRREEYRSMGINPHMEMVTPKDGEKWKQAVRDRQELLKHFGR